LGKTAEKTPDFEKFFLF